ncbi:MAG: DMT family transporter [Burkholderiales bacterium]
MSEKASLHGFGSGLLGVVIFSGSLPATRAAVGSLSPVFLTSARAAIAALLGALLLKVLRESRPSRGDLVPLAIVAGGVVVAFPLLTALALQHMTSARSVVFVGLLPLATALFAVVRAGERPRPLFWLFSALGAATVVAFALHSNGGEGDTSLLGDVLMVTAVAACGLGYAEGARLSRRLGGWQVISWSLLLAAPLTVACAFVTLPPSLASVSMPAWLGLAYVSVFSMLVGFVFWYRGLALGGIARVGQLQLLQPFFGLALSALLLGETVAWTMLAATGLVVISVAFARRYG